MSVFADRTCVVIHFLWQEQPYVDLTIGHGHLMFWTKDDVLTTWGEVPWVNRHKDYRELTAVLEPFVKWAGASERRCDGMRCREDITHHAQAIVADMMAQMHGSGLLTPEELRRPMQVHLKIDEPKQESVHWMWRHGPEGITTPQPPEKALLVPRLELDEALTK